MRVGLFSRYVFVGLDRSGNQYAELVRDCDGVENILSFHFDKRPHVVPTKQMQITMQAAWKAQTDKEFVVPQTFSIGDNVLIPTQHFRKLPAVMTACHEAKGIVTAEAEMMGQAVLVLAPVDKCKKVS